VVMVVCVRTSQNWRKLLVDSLRKYGTVLTADFAREFSLGADKRILLAVDQAGWHTSKDIELPSAAFDIFAFHLNYNLRKDCGQW